MNTKEFLQYHFLGDVNTQYAQYRMYGPPLDISTSLEYGFPKERLLFQVF